MICPYSWWLHCLWLCQEHVLWWGTLVRLCFANTFISSFYGFRHHSSFYKQGGDPCEDEMDISGDFPNERCLQKNKSPWSSEFCLTDTRVHTHAHSSSFYLRLSLFYIVSRWIQYSCSVPTQALPPTKSLEVVFSRPLGTSRKVTPSFFFLVGLVEFFTVDNQRQEHMVTQ